MMWLLAKIHSRFELIEGKLKLFLINLLHENVTFINKCGTFVNLKNIECDWPYAARRYNDSGINAYHYQVRVLRNVLRLRKSSVTTLDKTDMSR